jgi:hypothetical protein
MAGSSERTEDAAATAAITIPRAETRLRYASPAFRPGDFGFPCRIGNSELGSTKVLPMCPD